MAINLLKYLLIKISILVSILILIVNCNTTKHNNTNESKAITTVSDTLKISNPDLEYEILIIEPGFNTWLETSAKPSGFYSKTFMETRNIEYVNIWNQRVNQYRNNTKGLYEMEIDYQSNIDYGYDVNYKLYNYFIYFQLTYKQRLGVFSPRI